MEKQALKALKGHLLRIAEEVANYGLYLIIYIDYTLLYI